MSVTDDIRNYYEQIVVDHIYAQDIHLRYSKEFIADLCCLVLNKLPPRYIRYEVDMAFFLSQQERADMNERVKETVQSVLTYLDQRQEDDPNEEDRRR